MAFILHSSRSVSSSDVHILSVRKVAFYCGVAVLAMSGVAFGAGVLVGQYHAEPEAVVAAGPQDAVKEKFTFDRLGDMTGRLVKLESDTHALIKKLGSLQELQNRLAKIDDNKTAVLPHTIPKGVAAGGPMMAPKQCWIEQQLKPKSTGKSLEAAEKSMSCIQGMLDKVEQATARQVVAYMAMPIRIPVSFNRIGSGYGNRIDPINGRLSFHPGIDFDAPIGTVVHSAGGGRVTIAGWMNDYGNMVAIDHGNGLISRYGHSSKVLVKVGDVVIPGQPIALVGSTGRSTGPHVHFEIIHNGRYVNPMPYLKIGTQISNV